MSCRPFENFLFCSPVSQDFARFYILRCSFEAAKFARTKFCRSKGSCGAGLPVPRPPQAGRSQPLRVRGSAMPRRGSFWRVISGIADNRHFLILELDARAGGCPHPAASLPSRTRTALARSERPSERPAKALPKQGRSGDAGHNETRGLAGGAIKTDLFIN